MANPTTMIGLKAATISLTASTEETLALDPQVQYGLVHRGLDLAGNLQANRIDFGVNGTASGLAANPDVFSLLGNEKIEIGPGISEIKFQSGADPVFFIVEQQYFSIIN